VKNRRQQQFMIVSSLASLPTPLKHRDDDIRYLGVFFFFLFVAPLKNKKQ
jgi:hypothetical protein